MNEVVSQEQNQISYDEIMTRARAAKVCPYPHHCERKEFISLEWHMKAKSSPWEVWTKKDVEGDDVCTEVVFAGTKSECEKQFEYELRNMPHLFWLEEKGRCLVCDMYEKRGAAIENNVCPPFLVVAYGISRHYGGPEEGGWYYDNTTILEVRKAYTWEQGVRQFRKLKEEYPTQRYGRGSVLGNGDDVYVRCVYSEADPRFPQENHWRPHYC